MNTFLQALLVSAFIAALVFLLLVRIEVFSGWCGNTVVKGIGRPVHCSFGFRSTHCLRRYRCHLGSLATAYQVK